MVRGPCEKYRCWRLAFADCTRAMDLDGGDAIQLCAAMIGDDKAQALGGLPRRTPLFSTNFAFFGPDSLDYCRFRKKPALELPPNALIISTRGS